MLDTMASISARIPDTLDRGLRACAKTTGRTASEAIRDALQAYLRDVPPAESFYGQAKRLGAIGCARSLPSDLSTNPKHMDGFGK